MKIRKLKSNTTGKLYLHSMPGRKEPLSECFGAIKQHGISLIICLAAEEEITKKSPNYAATITGNKIPVKRICFPIPDYGIPEDIKGFYGLAREIAERLMSGENLLVHCAGGIGRTGMFAGCILKALGEPMDALEESGSGPEDEAQEKVIQNF